MAVFSRMPLPRKQDLHSALLRETQTLMEKLATTNILNGKTIQRASPWKSYRISNVPRKFGTTNEYLHNHLEPVTTESMTDAIAAAVGTPPALVTPSRDKETQPDSSTTSWIIRFKEEELLSPERFSSLATGRVHDSPHPALP